jgi:hypothetical protein
MSSGSRLSSRLKVQEWESGVAHVGCSSGGVSSVGSVGISSIGTTNNRGKGSKASNQILRWVPGRGNMGWFFRLCPVFGIIGFGMAVWKYWC